MAQRETSGGLGEEVQLNAITSSSLLSDTPVKVMVTPPSDQLPDLMSLGLIEPNSVPAHGGVKPPSATAVPALRTTEVERSRAPTATSAIPARLRGRGSFLAFQDLYRFMSDSEMSVYLFFLTGMNSTHIASCRLPLPEPDARPSG